MTTPIIDRLVSKNGWNLQSWQVRYGTGVFVVIAPQTGYLDQIREITTGANIEATEIGFYFNDEGAWLPVVEAQNVSEGLLNLEEKLKEFDGSDEWIRAVYDTFERIAEVNDGHYGLRIALDKKDELLFRPKTI